MKNKETELDPEISCLIQEALSLGATQGAIIPTHSISAEKELAEYCRDPGCENFGLSLSCPPHVQGPKTFHQWRKEYNWSLFFKIEVEEEMLFSHHRREIFQFLHELAAQVEIQAVKQGFHRARAFAGGSCKAAFCYAKPHCRALSSSGSCRHPNQARPSMSGFGINVGKLIESAGWEVEPFLEGRDSPSSKRSGVYGLVLIH